MERLARKELEDFGYYVVRSAGSHGVFDLVAVNRYEFRLIQIKAEGAASKADEQKLAEIKVPYCAFKELWERKGTEWKKRVIL